MVVSSLILASWWWRLVGRGGIVSLDYGLNIRYGNSQTLRMPDMTSDGEKEMMLSNDPIRCAPTRWRSSNGIVRGTIDVVGHLRKKSAFSCHKSIFLSLSRFHCE